MPTAIVRMATSENPGVLSSARSACLKSVINVSGKTPGRRVRLALEQPVCLRSGGGIRAANGGQRPVVARERPKSNGVGRVSDWCQTPVRHGSDTGPTPSDGTCPARPVGRCGRMRAEVVMRSRLLSVALILAGLFALAPLPSGPLHAQPADAAALTGLVTAVDEGPLEGVLVSAKKTGSTITTTVVTDASGRYRFPRSRIEPGPYALRIKATGYDLDTAATAAVTAARTATVDLKLRKARDIAAQLSNAEWLASFPGSDEQKGSIRGCTHCHTLERVARTKYTADQFMAVIERM